MTGKLNFDLISNGFGRKKAKPENLSHRRSRVVNYKDIVVAKTHLSIIFVKAIALVERNKNKKISVGDHE